MLLWRVNVTLGSGDINYVQPLNKMRMKKKKAKNCVNSPSFLGSVEPFMYFCHVMWIGTMYYNKGIKEK